TATVILQLNESGLLNLDDDINKHLPFDVRHPSYPGEPITIRMLLTHTSGIQTNLYWSLEYYFDDQMIDWINENLDLGPDIIAWAHRPTLEEFLNGSLNPAGPYYDSYNWYARPGNQYCYSNAGFQLLGYLIEVVSNQSLMDYVQENIFDPLNMSNSGYNYIDFVEKNAIPYEWKTHPIFSFFGYNFEFPFYNINVTGAGSIRTTVQDIAKFLITQMNQGELNGTHLLNPESVELMHSIQVSLTGHSTEGFDYEGYGLGWNIFSDGIIGHGGATPGFSSNMVFKKTNEGNFGMIIMFNRGSALIWDEELVNNFIPTVNQLIFEHAEKMFQQALST
ncbi:MAG: serine hydrolase domain-containing protein, partial [Candidatus Thorarchaeota archaeon]